MAIQQQNITGVVATGNVLNTPFIQAVAITATDNYRLNLHTITSDGYAADIADGYIILTVKPSNSNTVSTPALISRQLTVSNATTADGYFSIFTSDTVKFNSNSSYSYDVKQIDGYGNISEIVPLSPFIVSNTNYTINQQVTTGSTPPLPGLPIPSPVGNAGKFLYDLDGSTIQWQPIPGSSGTVTSVATDATLAGGPITVAGTLGIDLAHANTWIGAQTLNTPVIKGASSTGSAAIDFSGSTGAFLTPTGQTTIGGKLIQLQGGIFVGGIDNVGTAQSVHTTIRNTTAAILDSQQYSPLIEMVGNGWAVNGGGSSLAVGSALQTRPLQTGTIADAEMVVYTQKGGGVYTEQLSIGNGNTIKSPSGTAITLKSGQSAGSIQFLLDTVSTATSTMLDIRNNSTSKLQIDSSGNILFQSSGATIGNAGSTVGLSVEHVSGYVSVFGSGFAPNADISQQLGSASSRFSSLFIGNNSVGTAQTQGIQLSNNTAATSGSQKYSPMLEFVGDGYGTTGGASQSVKSAWQLRPVQGTVSDVDMVLWSQIGGGSYVEQMKINANTRSLGGGVTVGFAPGGGGVTFTTNVANSGANEAFVINNTTTLSTAGRLLFDVQNNGGTAFWVSADSIAHATSYQGNFMQFGATGSYIQFLASSGAIGTSNNPTIDWTAALFNPHSASTVQLGKTGNTWSATWSDVYATSLNGNISSTGTNITIAPTKGITHITGTGSIQTITVPVASFIGSITLIPDAVWTLTTGGNIALAATAVVNKPMVLTFDGTSWYGSYQ